MLVYPDNFFYFITLFSISSFVGTYLLLTNKRNHLLIINAVLLFLCGLKVAVEYYIHQIEEFDNLIPFLYFSRIIHILSGTCFWYIIWFYVRPFKGYSFEKRLNQFYFWVLVVFPMPIMIYLNLGDFLFEVAPTKIDGYWRFHYKSETVIARITQIYLLFIMGGITFATMLVEIKRNKKNRLSKILALLCFVFLPVIQTAVLQPSKMEKWTISTSGIIVLCISLSITWFVSNYRFLNDPFNRTISNLLDSISDLAFFTDPNFIIVNSNQVAAQEFGALGLEKDMLTLLSKHSQLTLEQINQLVKNLAVEKNKAKELKLFIDGKEKIYQLKIAKFEQGNLHLGYTFLFTNLTEILERAQEFKVANAIKDNLFAIISHDLRKPALAFRGISKKVNFLLQEKRFDDLNKFGSSLEKAAYSLNSLLDNLLNWALRQRGVLPYQPKNIKVAEVTQEILALFNQMAEDKNITLNTTISEQETAFVDENAYATIIRNLVDNAIKYTPVGGQIDLSAEKSDKTIIIRVKDSGIGIPSETIVTLFDFKANKSKRGTEGEKGTGLGLTLVRDLVKLNKGNITVKKNLNQGVILEVELPIILK